MKQLQIYLVGIYALLLVTTEHCWRMDVSVDMQTWIEFDQGPPGAWLVLANSGEQQLFWRLVEIDGVQQSND